MSTPGRPFWIRAWKNTEKNVHVIMPYLLIHPRQQGVLLVNSNYRLLKVEWQHAILVPSNKRDLFVYDFVLA
jgi:hypothetical protein